VPKRASRRRGPSRAGCLLIVKDAHDQKLAYVYFEDEPAVARLPPPRADEARRIAGSG